MSERHGKKNEKKYKCKCKEIFIEKYKCCPETSSVIVSCKESTKSSSECKKTPEKCKKEVEKCADKCEIKIDPCVYPKCVLEVEKNLLNLSYASERESITGSPFTAIFEIIIRNNTCNKISNLSIVDSLLGLTPKCVLRSDSEEDNHALITSVAVIGCDSTFVPLKSHEIIENCGELLDVCRSYIEPCGTARLTLRITGSGYIFNCDEREFKFTSLMQNTSLIKGLLHFGKHKRIPIFPIYVKTGVFEGFKPPV